MRSSEYQQEERERRIPDSRENRLKTRLPPTLRHRLWPRHFPKACFRRTKSVWQVSMMQITCACALSAWKNALAEVQRGRKDMTPTYHQSEGK